MSKLSKKKFQCVLLGRKTKGKIPETIAFGSTMLTEISEGQRKILSIAAKLVLVT